ncbi:MAG: peptidase S10 [Atopobiaceae bacterium]|nr:peptidase S10 [Atopobiaceae bacterium]
MQDTIPTSSDEGKDTTATGERNPSSGGSSRWADVPEAASASLTWTAGDRPLDYTACASHLDVTADDGSPIGRMFSLSYVATTDGAPDPTRPVTFCYNGGPGCASVPVNFGGIGPRCVVTSGLDHLSSPAQVKDNPYTLLPSSDLVFLDALGTGWSTVADGVDTGKVFGIDGDADAFARAIECWIERNGRWSSPVYLFGESYGTVRNAVLMRLLGERSVPVAGVVMLSAIFDWAQTLPGNDLYYEGMLPVYAAAAHHFGRAGQGKDVDAWYDDALGFAEADYAEALILGDRCDAAQREHVAQRVSELCGVSRGFVLERDLRIELDDFRRELLRDEGRVCGRLDMRFSSDAPSHVQVDSGFFEGEDAADDAVESAWTAAFRDFVSRELGYRPHRRYLNDNYEVVGKNWRWEHEEPGVGFKVPAPNVAVDIACALKRSPTTRLAILGGRYDAATPFWNVRHDMADLFLSDELKGNITWKRYGCGHMAYVDVPTLEAMAADLAAFYAGR